jgi:hypothetical protein
MRDGQDDPAAEAALGERLVDEALDLRPRDASGNDGQVGELGELWRLGRVPRNGWFRRTTQVAPCVATSQARIEASAIGNVFFDVSDGNFSVVNTPPTVSVAAVGGAVDNACQLVVTFSGTVVDDCGVSANAVSVQAIKGGNNFDLGPVQFNAQQTNAQTVSVSGSVLVSNVSASPALLTIKLTGADACGACRPTARRSRSSTIPRPRYRRR